MRTTIRPFTLIFSLLILTGFGAVPYFLFFEKGLTEINVATVTGAVMTALFLLGVFAVAWLTLFVRIDLIAQKITFTYPLRLQKNDF